MDYETPGPWAQTCERRPPSPQPHPPPLLRSSETHRLKETENTLCRELILCLLVIFVIVIASLLTTKILRSFVVSKCLFVIILCCLCSHRTPLCSHFVTFCGFLAPLCSQLIDFPTRNVNSHFTERLWISPSPRLFGPVIKPSPTWLHQKTRWTWLTELSGTPFVSQVPEFGLKCSHI